MWPGAALTASWAGLCELLQGRPGAAGGLCGEGSPGVGAGASSAYTRPARAHLSMVFVGFALEFP